MAKLGSVGFCETGQGFWDTAMWGLAMYGKDFMVRQGI